MRIVTRGVHRYSDAWYNRIVSENGAKYAVPTSTSKGNEKHEAWKMLRMQKRRV